MKRFFTSDMHFFHKNIVTKYGRNGLFQSLDEMHDHMISVWNKHVTKKDLVYIVGDFSFGDKEQTRGVLSRLNGQKILIVGNHDKRSKRHITVSEFIEIGFSDVQDEEVIKISNGVPVLLKHYPYSESELKLFFLKLMGKLGPWKTYYAFYPIDKGLWHIHGHIHGGPRVHGRQINVNVESWDYRPISESEICRIINDAKNKKTSHRIKMFFNLVKWKVIGKMFGMGRSSPER